MRKIILLLVFALSLLNYNSGWAQCATPLQNLVEDFNTQPDANDRSILQDCWGVYYTFVDRGREIGSIQANGSAIAMNSTYGAELYSPMVENGLGTISFKATSSSGIVLELGYYSGGFNLIQSFTMGSSSTNIYTHDLSTTGFSGTGNLYFRFASNTGSLINLTLDDVEYKSYCLPVATPTAIAKDIIAQLDDTGNVIVSPSSVDDGSTDSCGEFITNFSLDNTLFTCDDLGANTVILTATDSEGQTATATATITVEPSVTFNYNGISLDSDGLATVSVEDLVNSTTACSAIAYSLDQTSFTCSDTGYNTLTVTATYGADSKTFTTTRNIIDYLFPEVVAQDIVVSVDESTGLAEITTSMIDNGSTDNCGIASMSLSKYSFDCGDQGENEVTLTITDDSGNIATATATVTVSSFVPEVNVSVGTGTSVPVCFDGNNSSNTSVITDDSMLGADYYLRNSADSSIVDGPVAGTGTAIAFQSGSITENTKLHVYAEVPFEGQAYLSDANGGSYIDIDTPGSFDYAAGYTISAWVKVGSAWNSTYYNTLFYAGGATGSDIEVYENINGDLTILHNRGNTGTQDYYVTTGDPITNDTYLHLAVTYDGSISRVFVNGVQKGAAYIGAPVKSASSEMTFGYLKSTTFSGGQAFNGALLDEIRVYDQALTAEDILSDYDKCISGTEDNLVLYYDLESASGSILTDLVSSTPAQMIGGGVLSSDGAISCSFTCNRIMSTEIEIGDFSLPELNLNNITVDLDPNSYAKTITLDDIDNGSTDNCTSLESLKVTLSQSVFTCADEGVNTVMVTITDEAGNADSTEVEITVNEFISNVSISTPTTAFCDGSNTDGIVISTDVSTEGITYNLVNSAQNIVATASGTGSALEFNTGTISENTNYYVSAETGRSDTNWGHDFNGSNARMDTRYTLPQTSSLTIELWVYPREANYNRFVSNYAGSGTIGNGILIIDSYDATLNDGTGLRAMFGTSGDSFEVSVPSVLTLNEWNHIAMTFNSGVVKLYVDGLEVHTETSTTLTEIAAISSSVYLAEDRSAVYNSTELFNGQMDEFRVWNEVRSQEQILSTKGFCLQGDEENLHAYYPFDEGSGNTPYSLVSGGTYGIIYGTRTWVNPTNGLFCIGCSKQVSEEIAISIGASPALASSQNLTVSLDASGNVTIAPEDVEDGSVNECTADGDQAVFSLDKTTFDCSDLGENTVILSVTDASSNVTTATAIVTIIDDAIPTGSINDLNIVLDNTESASIVLADVFDTPVDNCTMAEDLIISIDKTDFSCLDVGVNTITVSVTDDNMNTATFTSTVTVSETILPTAVTQNIEIELDANGAVSIFPSQVNNGSTDNCTDENLTFSVDKTDFTCTDMGTNTVILTVMDVSGNEATQTTTITVVDNMEPTVVAKNIVVSIGSSSGNVSITAEDIDNGSTDNCTAVDDLIFSLDITSFDIDDVGENNVSLTVEDASGNIGTATAIVTVSDKEVQAITFGTLSDATYGALDQTLSATASSALSVSFAVVSGPATIIGDQLSITGVGIVTIEASQSGDANYLAADAVEQSFSVSQATLVVTADNYTINYGEAVPTLTYSYSGFVNGEDENYLSTIPTVAVDTDGNAGTYAITLATGGFALSEALLSTIDVGIKTEVADNYDLTLVNGTLIINKLALTATADDQHINYGEAIPTLTYSYSGFVNGEDESYLSTIPTIAVDTDGDAGTYDITLSTGELVLKKGALLSIVDVEPIINKVDNYSLTLVDGTLTINQLTVQVTISDLEHEVDGLVKTPTVVTDPSGLSYTISYDGSSIAPTKAGSYDVSVVIDETNYTGSANAILILTGITLSSQTSIETDVNVYPNPISNEINVEVFHVTTGSIRLFDIHGADVMRGVITNGKAQYNLSNLKGGVYIIDIYDDNSQLIKRQKVIVK